MGAPLTAPGAMSKNEPPSAKYWLCLHVLAFKVHHYLVHGRRLSAIVGVLFVPLCEFVKNLKICPSPTLGGRGVKFVRPVGDLNTPNQKNFGGPPVKFGGARGGQTFFFPPSPLKNPSSDFGNFVTFCSGPCPVRRVKISSKSDDQFFR